MDDCLDEVWRSEKSALRGAQDAKEKLEAARIAFDAARRSGDLARMSELQYGVIPELEAELAQPVEEVVHTLLRNKKTTKQSSPPIEVQVMTINMQPESSKTELSLGVKLPFKMLHFPI